MEESSNTNVEQDKPWWAIYVDIEGYSNLFMNDPTKCRQLSVLLADDVCKVASVFSYLGIHQFGADGFLINAVSISKPIHNAISISTALLRQSLEYNSVRKVQISFGSLGDFSSYYEDIEKKYGGTIKDGTLQVKNSLITFTPALVGNALIRAYKLESKKGPLLCIDNIYKKELMDLGLTIENDGELITINWLKHLGESIEQEVALIRGKDYDENEIRNLFTNYIFSQTDGCNKEWLKNANSLLE